MTFWTASPLQANAILISSSTLKVSRSKELYSCSLLCLGYITRLDVLKSICLYVLGHVTDWGWSGCTEIMNQFLRTVKSEMPVSSRRQLMTGFTEFSK